MTDNRGELYYSGHTNKIVAALVQIDDSWVDVFERVTVRPGQTLVHGGTRPALLHFPINSVCVDLVSPTGWSPSAAPASVAGENKDNTVQVAMHGDAGMVGIQALISNSLSSRMTVVDHGGQALRCQISAARRMMDSSPASRELLLNFTALALEELAQQAAGQQRLGVPERVAAYLLETLNLLREQTLPLTHIHISKRLGCRRPSVTEALTAMTNEGVLRQVDKGRIEVLNEHALRARVEGAWPSLFHGRQAFTERLSAAA
ncbi:Crp/Fnr family transcriptional regulator [Methylobacterium sp. Leaf361]|uniref:Crp/Fnr family transcriptional regulator n=1 Tax=Methylobacterium sp. Leaf361 TaxID=1736352 RepID=UPI0009E8E550|nr:Crp/Fnr family transcriptional regulator [Methylobacterium sp. Leaf361]